MRRERVVAAIGAVFFGVLGLWAFLAPRSFYNAIATYPPFNRHLIHDMGAFQLGLAAVLVAALAWEDALLAALTASAAGSLLHALAHLLDLNVRGGNIADVIFVALIGVLLATGAVWRHRVVRGLTARRSRLL